MGYRKLYKPLFLWVDITVNIVTNLMWIGVVSSFQPQDIECLK